MRYVIWVLLFCSVLGCDSKDKTRADATDAVDEQDVTDTLEDIADDTVVDDGSGVESECAEDVDCDDSDPCTVDTCSVDGDCEHAYMDADGDGVAPEFCGGDDCDDDDDTTYAGAPPLCDGGDHDCDGVRDDDMDGDGYLSIVVCPGVGDDCCDYSDVIHPEADWSSVSVLLPVECIGSISAWDLDCSGTIEREFADDIGTCDAVETMPPMCNFHEGWTSPTNCGEEGEFITDCSPPDTCNTTTETRTQRCR